MRIKFSSQGAVFAAKVSQELSTSQLKQIIWCEFVLSKFVAFALAGINKYLGQFSVYDWSKPIARRCIIG